jgi:hypothetical protein
MTEEEYTAYIKEWGKVERKGKKNPYTSHNGHMFTFLDTQNEYLAVRLSADEKKSFNEKHNQGDVIQYNSVMNGYVEIPSNMAKNKEEVFEMLDQSFDFINSLKPKPTKKKK